MLQLWGMQTDSAPVRPGEELDRARLQQYLRGRIDGASDGFTVEQFPGGHSNLTYLLRSPVREYVLRRAPLGPVAPKAHDMGREFNVLRAVHPYFQLAPEAFHLCEDLSIIGAVFFVMERRTGTIIRGILPGQLAGHERSISAAFVNCLAELHSIDIQKTGLQRLGKPDGYLERQVRGWAERWTRARTGDEIALEDLIAWLQSHVPRSPAPTLVHNDFKLDNLMLDAGGRSITAVLDWEMATVGDPLADLGLALCYWTQPAGLKGEPALTLGPGWYTRDEIAHAYARSTGRDLSEILYYEVFGLFKLAVVLQQIYFRWKRGQTSDERFRGFGERVRQLVQRARELAL